MRNLHERKSVRGVHVMGFAGIAMLAVLGAGCVHPIALHEQDTSWHYTVDATEIDDAAMVAVIDEETLASEYAFRAFSTGLAHKWVAKYGVMLGQVADVEFPQLVGDYERVTAYTEPATGKRRLTVVLTVTSYAFKDFRAEMAVHVEAFGPGKIPLFSRDYTANGDKAAGKMMNLGAMGQKSAVRQSTLSALKQVFDEMRPDVVATLGTPATLAN